jgi:hypothetical protein
MDLTRRDRTECHISRDGDRGRLCPDGSVAELPVPIITPAIGKPAGCNPTRGKGTSTKFRKCIVAIDGDRGGAKVVCGTIAKLAGGVSSPAIGRVGWCHAAHVVLTSYYADEGLITGHRHWCGDWWSVTVHETVAEVFSAPPTVRGTT